MEIRMTQTRARHSEGGYVLLTMMLFLTLVLIAATAAAPKIAFQIKRDREEELIHRGVEYSRAIQKFSKKTGRFPTRLEELEDTSGLRFIRRLYKDPITGRDFQLLHLSDIRPSSGVTNLNANPKQEDSAADTSGDGSAAAPQPTVATHPNRSNNNNVSSGPQVIFGVASPSKARSIREFNHKDHYNQWLFFYDPSLDKGYLIKGPATPFVPPVPGSQQSADGQQNQ